ncbi:bZIP transcription factor [Bifidobacterium bombi]|uniref:Uncharacterized protein n=1 Tax=Bifidobacterium bombi DSM 19703 TaxID=1341695 RepID=A0A080N3E6_9BIFI|nr:bZIP transcription factor [Bifidobacterium bombi]KFF31678.1 hypothetical protein BBOMB_1065 [Bifidobacterium bombi DSM 19703]
MDITAIIPSIISGLVSIAIAVVGWVITWRSSKRRDEEINDAAAQESRKRAEDLENMSQQVQALREQAAALKKQVSIAMDQDAVPKWDLHQANGVIYELVNGNTHTALDVRIEPVAGSIDDSDKIELGNIDPGSASTFDFDLAATSAAPDSVLITWLPKGFDERKKVRTALPPYVHQ